ncbi:MAG TPA: ATP phosphoribosyltransferase regulatory subunit [Lachnospiraceae bacterium]|nr:ATP phosphoribosyltransferase regulatory subunit [Lachnospiraceae bacterium]
MSQRLLHTPEGVRDLYGKEYAEKLYVENRLRESIHLYGYEDIQTPTFEFFDIFSREIGTTPSRELYKFFDKEGNTLVLRPDFTPSIARCAAKYFCEEQVPLRFSYLGSTFTNTSSLQGKLREVTQMGVELINDPSAEADAEIISLVVHALRSTGLERFQVAIGDVEYFKGLCEEAGLDEETELDLRAFISGKNYFAAQALLEERGVREAYQDRLLRLADFFGDMSSLSEAGAMAGNERSRRAVERLEQTASLLKLYGVQDYVSFDLGILSKYRYYTGMVFKAYTYGVGEAIVKGGRYDRLLQQFGKDAPAVGSVMVVDSILEALSRQNVNIPVPEEVRTISYSHDNYCGKLAQAQQLRSQGIPVKLTPC